MECILHLRYRHSTRTCFDASQAAAAAKAQVERELPEAAAKAILDIYASSAPDKSAAVSTLLQRMGFSSAAASS